jgi:hypothetical protein
MGIIDKNYLNRINQKVQNELKNQPCGCDCDCRPKFEDDATPIPPSCNCHLNNPQFVGDWIDGRGSLNTGQLTLDFDGGQNCPMDLLFNWTNSNFISATVILKTSSQVIPMTEGVQYLITLNPFEWVMFVFSGQQQTFDQYLTIECENVTCGENYGQVGEYTLVAI